MKDLMSLFSFERVFYTVKILNWLITSCNLTEIFFFFPGVVSAEGVHTTAVKEGQLYETVTLKWCTPRSSSVGNWFILTKYYF